MQGAPGRRRPRMAPDSAAALASRLAEPGPRGETPPDPTRILFDAVEPPPFPENNIFPLEWVVETPKLQTLYDVARDPGWRPDKLDWASLDPGPSPPRSARRSPTGTASSPSSTARARRSSPAR